MTTNGTAAYVPYSDGLEQLQPDEEALVEQILASMLRVNRRASDRHRHGLRDAHAKSHGILKGELIVEPDLPDHLRQGVFAEPARYPVIVRFSTAPGDLQSDRVPSPRGMAIKLLGVPGEKLMPEDHSRNQDLLLVNHPVIPFGHVKAYWETQQLLEKTDGSPETLLRIAAAVARGAAQLFKAAHVEVPAAIEAIAATNHHVLGETFHSMAALRYGDYVAKLSAAPASDEIRALTGTPVATDHGDSPLRDLVVEHFAHHGAEYALRAQLCTGLDAMPIEDASVEWKEAASPHQVVGRIVLPAQHAYSDARRIYGDDVLSFSPWRGLAAHRPLGSIMRIRRAAYEQSSHTRHAMNAAPRIEPHDVAELPE
jgi:hypothetical protein